MKENWKVGNHKSTVVSDSKQRNANFPHFNNPSESPDSDVEYYGGYLVCESVANESAAKLIAVAPEMLQLLQDLTEWSNNSKGLIADITIRAEEIIKKAKGNEP